jgi:hypothetical protein
VNCLYLTDYAVPEFDVKYDLTIVIDKYESEEHQVIYAKIMVEWSSGCLKDTLSCPS